MKSLLRIATVILTLNILRYCHPVNAGFDVSKTTSTTPPIMACGPALADALSTVCQGIYNGKKRSNIRYNDVIPDTDYYNDEAYPDGEFPMSANLFRSKRTMLSLLKSIRLKRDEKVVDECCHKACTYEEIKGYCG